MVPQDFLRMEYNIHHPKRKSIFAVFLHNDHATFTTIEKETRLRSNEVAYFLNQLISEGAIIKDGESYRLSETAEKYVPFVVDSSEKLSPLPVVLIAFQHHGKLLLLKRKKRPYLDYWGLPGGRIRINETIEAAATRILHEKAFAHGTFTGVNAVVHERHDTGSVLHAFLLILVSVEGEPLKETDERIWATIEDLDMIRMIPSDKWLAKHKLGERITIPSETITENEEGLTIHMTNGDLSNTPGGL